MSEHTLTAEEIQEAVQEIEQILWRAAGAEEGSGERGRHLGTLDDEVSSVTMGLDQSQRIAVMGAIVEHLERQQGLPSELIDEVFPFSRVSRAEVVAWQLEQSTAVPSLKTTAHRI